MWYICVHTKPQWRCYSPDMRLYMSMICIVHMPINLLCLLLLSRLLPGLLFDTQNSIIALRNMETPFRIPEHLLASVKSIYCFHTEKWPLKLNTEDTILTIELALLEVW